MNGASPPPQKYSHGEDTPACLLVSMFRSASSPCSWHSWPSPLSGCKVPVELSPCTTNTIFVSGCFSRAAFTSCMLTSNKSCKETRWRSSLRSTQGVAGAVLHAFKLAIKTWWNASWKLHFGFSGPDWPILTARAAPDRLQSCNYRTPHKR